MGSVVQLLGYCTCMSELECFPVDLAPPCPTTMVFHAILRRSMFRRELGVGQVDRGRGRVEESEAGREGGMHRVWGGKKGGREEGRKGGKEEGREGEIQYKCSDMEEDAGLK
eukprot:388188-Rhodomonas_salina.1